MRVAPTLLGASKCRVGSRLVTIDEQRSFQIPEDFCRCSNQDTCQAGFTTSDETMEEPTPVFQHIPYQIPKAHPEIEVTEEFSRAANARVLARALPTLEQTFYFHNCLFSGDFVYTNFESTSFWQIYLNGLKLNNAAVTSRLSIAALLSLSTPSCPLKSTPLNWGVAKEYVTSSLSRIVQWSRRKSGCWCKYLSTWIHTIKWCEVRRERKFVPGEVSPGVFTKLQCASCSVGSIAFCKRGALPRAMTHTHATKDTSLWTLTGEFTRTCLFDSRPSVHMCWQLPRAHMPTARNVRR